MCVSVLSCLIRRNLHIIISILLWPNQSQRRLNWKRYTHWMRSGDETNINCYTIIASHSLHRLTTYWTCNTISGKQQSNIIPKFYHTGLLCLTISYTIFFCCRSMLLFLDTCSNYRYFVSHSYITIPHALHSRCQLYNIVHHCSKDMPSTVTTILLNSNAYT